jgi:hypothetical protein
MAMTIKTKIVSEADGYFFSGDRFNDISKEDAVYLAGLIGFEYKGEGEDVADQRPEGYELGYDPEGFWCIAKSLGGRGIGQFEVYYEE